MRRLLPSLLQVQAQEHFERRVLPYAPAHVYGVVSRVQDYASFVPWCLRSDVVGVRGPHELDAALTVGFRAFSERYESRVTLVPGARVAAVASGSALFARLENEWRIEPGPHGPRSTALSFRVLWDFRSPLYAGVSQLFRDDVVRNMVSASEQRCERRWAILLIALRGCPAIRAEWVRGNA